MDLSSCFCECQNPWTLTAGYPKWWAFEKVTPFKTWQFWGSRFDFGGVCQNPVVSRVMVFDRFCWDMFFFLGNWLATFGLSSSFKLTFFVWQTRNRHRFTQMLVFRVHHSITVVWEKIPVLTRFCLECLYVLPLDIFITFCLLGKWGGICCFLENMFGCPSVNGSVLQKDPTQTSFGLVSTWRIIPVKWLITNGDRMSPRATFPFQMAYKWGLLTTY